MSKQDECSQPVVKSKYLVLAAKQTLGLRDDLVAKNPDIFQPMEVTFETFPDGTPQIAIKNVEALRYRNVVYITSLSEITDLLAQAAVIYAIPRYMAKSFTVVVPFFPTGTMERVDHEGEVATAMTLARILSATPLTSTGPTRFIFFDIHALQLRFYFADQIQPALLTAIPALKRRLQQDYGPSMKDVVIAFPDDGAKKRFGWMFGSTKEEQDKLVVCSKMRDGDKRIVKVTDNASAVQGKDVIIVDDLVQSGGTLLQCKEALSCGEYKARSVSCFVTHAVFPKQHDGKYAWEKFTNPAAGIKKFYITDSIARTVNAIKDKKPFEVIGLADELNEHFTQCMDADMH